LAEPGKGIAITDGDFYRPSLTILREDGVETQREVGGEKRLYRGQRLALTWLAGTEQFWSADHHHPEQSPRQHGMPQPRPRVDERPGFGGMRLPATPFAG
jgi:hypothetical protein